MKYLFILLLTPFVPCCLNAQRTVTPPDRNDWSSYFNNRLSTLQNELYNLAIKGKIKAYKTDSLNSFYSLAELQLRGSNKYVKSSNQPVDPRDTSLKLFSPSELKGIWLVQKTRSSLFDPVQNSSLTGVALIYQPSFHRMLMMPHPIFILSFEELKTICPPEDITFLTLLYQFSTHANTEFISPSDSPDDDIFLYYAAMRTSMYIIDSAMVRTMVNMCTATNEYIKDYMQANRHSKLIIDLQSQQLISFEQFNNTYFTPIKVQAVSIENNKEVLKDTVYNDPFDLHTINALGFSKGKPAQFFYSLPRENASSLSFAISLKELKDLQIAPVQLWFFEDYYRAKK